jgi:hypothetical protein
MHRGFPRHKAAVRGADRQFVRDPPRPPPRMLSVQLTHPRLHLRTGLMGTQRAGASGPSMPPVRLGHTGSTRYAALTRDPELGPYHGLGFAAPDGQHSSVTLFDNGQVDQSQSRLSIRPDVDQAQRSGLTVRPHCQASAGTGRDHYTLAARSVAELTSMGFNLYGIK